MKGKRGRYLLTLTGCRMVVLKQGLYEREEWTYDFRSDDGALFEYCGKRYALFVNKRYEITATDDGTRYGRTVLKRIRPQPAPLEGAELFER